MVSRASCRASWLSASLPRMRSMTRNSIPRWGRTRASKASGSPCAAVSTRAASGRTVRARPGSDIRGPWGARRPDGEGRAEARPATGGPHVAAVPGDDLLHEEEAQAGAGDLAGHLVAPAEKAG